MRPLDRTICLSPAVALLCFAVACAPGGLNVGLPDRNDPGSTAGSATGGTGDGSDAGSCGTQTDSFNSTDGQTSFQLSAPADGSDDFVVTLDGRTVPGTVGGNTVWSYDASSDSILFSTSYAPSADAVVTVTYTVDCTDGGTSGGGSPDGGSCGMQTDSFTATDGQTSFQLSQTANSGDDIVVTLDGRPLPDTTGGNAVWSYDASSNSVVFAAEYAAQAGETITVTYTVDCAGNGR